MQQVQGEEVIRRLRVENPWWEPPHSVPASYAQWRARPYLDVVFPLIVSRRVRRAVVLMGPRRVGKTYLIHHAIERLIGDFGIAPVQICYVSVDNPIYMHLSLDEIMRFYSEATGINTTKTETFFFFDEIQYLKAWELQLKAIVDGLPHVKCVASGSAAAALKLRSNESGAGRFTDFLLPPVTFHEYLVLLNKLSLIEIGDAGAEDEENDHIRVPDIAALNKQFLHYLNFGGYPEVIFSEEIQESPGRFIKSDIIDKVLLRDLPTLYGIQDIQELNRLFTVLAYNTAQEISLEDLSKHSGVAKQTIKRYIEYLEAAFLIRTVRRVDQGARHFQRARTFKVYLTNPSLRSALFSPLGESDQGLGALVETGIFAQWFHHQSHEFLHYTRWRKGEIDIVGMGSDLRVHWAVEVKWTDRFASHPLELSEAIAFCHRHKLEKLSVTTLTKRGRERIMGLQVDFTPAAIYAFLLGYAIVAERALGKEKAPTV